MSLPAVLEKWRHDPAFMSCVTAWKIIPPRAAREAPFPSQLDQRLVRALQALGITSLYSHQAAAIEAALDGKNLVLVTPTASGKTLAYNLPVLQQILSDATARALYLFPTKALAQDQLAGLYQLVELLGEDIKTFTYDGDTSPNARQAIRNAGHIVITNPDMLHNGILPHHTKWIRLFENLRYVVIDELHQYRGVFGSHVANVIRRLKRIASFYGSKPQFILTSATIANPKELATTLVEEEVVLIDDNGAPAGEKHLILYNPPVVNQQLGLRRSSLLEARRLSLELLTAGVKTITFTRSRLFMEVLLTYLRESFPPRLGAKERIRGYRGGYLPLERRQIERDLRQGQLLGIVSTNALELGIDIGQLEAAVIAGYPGSIASLWQQAGRAGRRQGASVAVLIASSAPLDQFLITHPDYFWGRSPELGLANPDNLYILANHVKCAAFELPFTDGEKLGRKEVGELLAYFEEQGILRHTGGRWYWSAENFPAEEISLRSASSENFVVVDITGEPRVLGEVDRISAPTLIHEGAIYLHQGEQYQVEKLDYENFKAYVRHVEVDFYTDAELAVQIKVLDVFREKRDQLASSFFGEVLVTSLPTRFKKIKFHTHENIGYGEIHLPEEQMHTAAYFLSLEPQLTAALSKEEQEGMILGLSHLLANVAPFYLMCDQRDLQTVPQVRGTHTGQPTIYLYDSYPGGIGLAERTFEIEDQLFSSALDLVTSCPCESGCPSCVGPVNEVGAKAKAATAAVLRQLVARG